MAPFRQRAFFGAETRVRDSAAARGMVQGAPLSSAIHGAVFRITQDRMGTRVALIVSALFLAPRPRLEHWRCAGRAPLHC